jgi:hypothetical protein
LQSNISQREAGLSDKKWGQVLQSNISQREAGLSDGSPFVSPLSSFADDGLLGSGEEHQALSIGKR